jgi:hypothetical protein
MTTEITDGKRDNYLFQFRAGLDKLRYELEKSLMKLDTSEVEKLREFIGVFNQRLGIFQNDFVDFLFKTVGGLSDELDKFRIEEVKFNISRERYAPILIGVGAGGLVLFLRSFLNMKILPTPWYYPGKASIARWLEITNIVNNPFIIVLAILAGLAGFMLMRKGILRRRKIYIKKRILEQFDSIRPKLEKWAELRISDLLLANKKS